ncbi:polygalacturonase [Stereum hirsutum FP-91666 SS1]|uniref:polygalacturonase n=1 Tax=Stereum hirsutum (strain FP-91666) TaxID=721885 RepID=UPI000440DBFC|nr:polygalacturonase [Stereum hirsutum FP-91666 SS1]EIM87418.1 polygalacturonase [Stereum hirsutum FP-91666 SS1]
MISTATLLSVFALAGTAVAVPSRTGTAKRATCTVNSVSSAAELSDCSDVVIAAFTVPGGSTVTIEAASGATVTMTGDVTFASTTSEGPLFTLQTDDVSFNGGGHTFDGNGPLYWDGEGTNGGKAKPHPFFKIKGSGTFENFEILNSPAQAISVGTTAKSTISSVTVDNSAGDSGALGHNTDGFDVSASDLTITGSTVKNQDDCVAINSGSSITFSNNVCSNGHGISIGSIASDKTVSGVTISGNTVTNSMYGMRIKVDADATDASVSDVTYSGNTISGATKFGMLISQTYPEDDSGTPGTGAPISDINFTGSKTSVSVESSAHGLVVDCGACSGTWDFSELTVTGGEGNSVSADDASLWVLSQITGGSF